MGCSCVQRLAGIQTLLLSSPHSQPTHPPVGYVVSFGGIVSLAYVISLVHEFKALFPPQQRVDGEESDEHQALGNDDK